MEMYADEDSRGGVLEPEGIVGIKYRKDRQLETMARLDPTYAELKQKLINNNLPAEEAQRIKAQMTEREELLLPVYSQISLQFADLHDRAGRMHAVGAIRHPLKWLNARRFFYWRLRRRLNEEYILKRMASATPAGTTLPRAQSLESLKAWCGVSDFEADDMAVASWYEENRKAITDKVDLVKKQTVANEVSALLVRDREAALRGVAQALSNLPTAEKQELLKQLAKA